MPIRVGIVGFGQIARVQHAAVIAASPDFELAAIATPEPHEIPPGVPCFASMDAMLDAAGIDAVALCTPPQIRGALARSAAARGKHVLLEKPPAGTVAEASLLEALGRASGVTMFAGWHSMFSACVAPLRAALAARGLAGMQIEWKEDVEKWHPGATWCWGPGGLGVFDPAINAFSIVAAVAPEPVFVTRASFAVAADAQTPHRATLAFATPTLRDGFSAELDWRHAGDEAWSITWRFADGGSASLQRGGAFLAIDDVVVVDAPDREYAGIYGRFAELIRAGDSEVELRPLQLAADAFMVAGRT